MSDEQKPSTESKRHQVLKDLVSQLHDKDIKDTVTISGVTFVLKAPLQEDEEVWADSMTRADSTIAFTTSNNNARVAASLVSVNDVPVGQLFGYPESMKQEVRDAIDGNKARKRYWVLAEVLAFLMEEGNRGFMDKLISKFRELDNRVKEATTEAPKS